MAWAMEMVQHEKLDIVRISFMIAGHTKFSVDQLFSRIAQSYNRSDVFTIAELGKVAEPYCSVVINQGEIVKEWRNPLTKYTNTPGIRSSHDFLFARKNGNTECRVRQYCHDGSLRCSTMKISNSHLPSEVVIPIASESYTSCGLVKQIGSTKRANLEQMYQNFISDKRLLEVLRDT